MYQHTSHGGHDDNHPGYHGPKQYGAQAEVDKIIHEDYEGKKDESAEYDPLKEYNPLEKSELYKTGKGEGKDKKEEKRSELDEVLEKEKEKKDHEEANWHRPASLDIPEGGPEKHSPRDSLDIIVGAFRKKVQESEGVDPVPAAEPVNAVPQADSHRLVHAAFKKQAEPKAGSHDIVHAAFKKRSVPSAGAHDLVHAAFRKQAKQDGGMPESPHKDSRPVGRSASKKKGVRRE